VVKNGAVQRAAQRELSALGHGIDGVEDQVGEHLAQLRGVAQDHRNFVAFQRHAHGDVASPRVATPSRARDLHRVAQDLRQIDRLERLVLAHAGELLNATHGLAAVLGGLFDHRQIGIDLGVEAALAQ